MALSKRDHEMMATTISGNLPDLAIKESATVLDPKGLVAVTRMAIAYMNHAYATTRTFNGHKFIEWAGLDPWVEVYEGFASKEARWTRRMQEVAGVVTIDA